MKNLIFLYGADAFRLRKRLKELFIADELNRLVIDVGESWDTARFASQAQAIPFLGPSRQIIVVGALRALSSDEALKVLNTIGQIPPTTNIIFAETSAPDKRTKFFKDLVKLAQVEIFEPLWGAAWSRYVQDESRRTDPMLSPAARDALTANLEGDSGQLHQVIVQLGLWAEGQEITAEDVALFTARRSDSDSFKMLGALSGKQAHSVVRFMLDLWRQNEDPLRVLGAVAYQYRQLLWTKAFLAEGVAPNQLASKLKSPPFVVSRLLSLAKSASWDWLKSIYREIAKIDESIKNGKIEARAGLEVLVYNLYVLHTSASTDTNLIRYS